MRRFAFVVIGLALAELGGGAATAFCSPPPAKPPAAGAPAADAKPSLQKVDVAELRFADPFLAAQFAVFLQAAEKAAPANWERSELLQRRAQQFRSTSYWKKWAETVDTSEPMIWKGEHPPSAGMLIMARGSTQSEAPIADIYLYGWSRPVKAWGAAVMYHLFVHAGQIREELDVRTFAPGQEASMLAPRMKFPLFDVAVSRDYPKSDLRTHSVLVRVPVEIAGLWSSFGKGQVPLGFIASDEEFRDAGLKNFHQLRETAKKTIPSGEAFFTVVSMRGVRSDNPPRDAPVDDSTRPDAARRQQLLADALQSIDEKEATFKTHAASMAAAIRNAFPFHEVLKTQASTSR